MESFKSTDSISPTWYRLQKSTSGQSYIQLPERPSGDLIFLTALQANDNVAMAAIIDDPLINDRLVSVPKPYTVADANFWITLQLSGKSALPLQALRSGDPELGAYIGGVTLIPTDISPASAAFQGSATDTVPGEYELGYSLHPMYHKNGIMKDAVLAILTWAIKECGISSVVVTAEENNLGSVKLIESIPIFSKVEQAKEVSWPEHKGGGLRKILTWRWH